ncbi:LamG domain-containing protein [Candidatus Poribacteria bacterium]
MKLACSLTGVAILLIAGIVTSSSYAKIDPETIVGMWLFDEDAGNIAVDSSGNGRDKTIVNGPVLVEGKFGKALEFDGVDDYIDCGLDESLKPQQFTVVAWFNTRKLDDYGHIFQSGKDWDDMAGIYLRVHKEGYLQAGVAQGPANNVSKIKGPALSTDVWYHTGLTFDGENVILYLDGVKIGSNTAQQVLYDGRSSVIGRKVEVNRFFDGFIDEVAFFNVALTQDDVNAIMNEGLEAIVNPIAVSATGKLTTTWGELKATK